MTLWTRDHQQVGKQLEQEWDERDRDAKNRWNVDLRQELVGNEHDFACSSLNASGPQLRGMCLSNI